MIRSLDQPYTRGTGFTLVEMLVVLGIIAILSALIIPPAGKILRGSQMSQAANVVVDQLNLARQSALSMNCLIEVRLYQFGDSDIAGQNPSTPSTGMYRAVQAFAIQSSGQAVALEKVQRLPGTVIIDSGSTLSPLIGSATSGTSTPAMTNGTSLSVSIPRVGTNYNAVTFRYLPDGSIKLPSTQQWFLTLHGAETGDSLPNPPTDFFTLQINPTNGHLQSFRP